MLAMSIEGEKGLELLWELAKERRTRIILALDYCGRDGCVAILEKTLKYIAGVKLGYPILFNIGLERIKSLVSRFRGSVFLIADFKIADIPSISGYISKKLREIGFDAAIVHAIVGEESVRSVSRVIPALALVAMSHKGSEIINSNVDKLIEVGRRGGATGYIAPATYPQVIKIVRKTVPNTTIFSPGVGVQGGGFGSALKSGADFEIIGRSITLSDDPENAAANIVLNQRKIIS